MNHLEDKDIREALRRKESRRQQPEEPSDFFEHVMEEISKTTPPTETVPMRPSSASRMRMTIILSLAASIALILLFAWPRFGGESQEQAKNNEITDSIKTEENQYTKQITEVMSLPEESVPQHGKDSQFRENVAMNETAPHTKRQDSHHVAKTSSDATDSLQYYIDKIERELAQIDESLYIDRMNKVIRADERLQRMVNSYILHTLDDEGRPQAAENMLNIKTQENEVQ